MPKIQYYAKKYIRLSRADEKDGESNSVTNQRILLDNFIAQNPDIEDMGEKVDDGFSGIVFDRPAFKELMDEVRAGEVNCIIVKDLSRFGREYIDTGNYLRRILPAYGVRFIALGDGIDTAKGTEGDDMMVSVRSVVNDAYCRDISTKTRSALATRREHGKFVGAYPVYGYRKSEEDKNRLVIDEYPAGVVRDIYSMKIDGLSAAAIADTLNGQCVLCPLEYKKDHNLPHAKKGFADVPNAKWSAVAVIRILSDETYTGTLAQGRQGTPNYKVKQLVPKPKSEWVRVENTHEAIILKNDFDLVQRLLLLDTRARPGENTAHPFSGILICGCCKNRMTRKTVTAGGKRYFYWYCPTGKKGCNAPVMLKEQKLDECVLETLKAHVANVASLDSLMMSVMKERAQGRQARQYQAQIEENERRLEKAAAMKAGLFEHLAGGVLEKHEYTELKHRYTVDAQNAQAAITSAKNNLANVLSGGSDRIRWMERFQAFANLAELDRRTVVSLVHSICVKGKEELEITLTYQDEYVKALTEFTAGTHRGEADKGVA